ncbi:MAG TPA: YicC/YloC family endoribonuclease [Vicinamibacterales bacterium]|nr:YicC/YloC family endoribonuclease [Vicinamibacterales bacterium]
MRIVGDTARTTDAMIKSMTGFASVTVENDEGVVGVTVRAVNHRYLDVQLRVPASLSDREAALRSAVQRVVSRGRIEMSISLQPRQPISPAVELNAAFVDALQAALSAARAQGLIEGRLTPGDLLRLPQALTIRERLAGESVSEGLLALVDRSVAGALADLDRMRIHEGQHLRADLDARRRLLAELMEGIAQAAAAGRTALEKRLTERVRELTSEMLVDWQSIAQEVVRTAARSDISEEVTRFKAHLAHWDALSDSPEPCGRKLDFLLQEMNREVNTIGAKADGVGVSELIVAAKAELEKMREQVQNVE